MRGLGRRGEDHLLGASLEVTLHLEALSSTLSVAARRPFADRTSDYGSMFCCAAHDSRAACSADYTGCVPRPEAGEPESLSLSAAILN